MSETFRRVGIRIVIHQKMISLNDEVKDGDVVLTFLEIRVFKQIQKLI
jgi:hypothetical protein